MKGSLKVGVLRIDKWGPYIITERSPRDCTIYPLSGGVGAVTFFHLTILEDSDDHILLTPEEWL